MWFKIVISICLILNTGILGKHVRILGGSETSITNHPHMVSIRSFITNTLLCGGSIISRWNILTAGHCLHGLNNDYSDTRIYAGTSSSISAIGSVYEIQNVVFHPDFKEVISANGILPHDICIIKLLQPITFSQFQNKIKLPTRNLVTGDIAVFTGWGLTTLSKSTNPTKLKQVSTIIYDSPECMLKVDKLMVLFKDQFCTFNDGGIGICDGDSGGAVTSKGELFGIIADTFECGQGLPDIHINVYYYLDFINSYIQK